jgi:hypothetical protein
MPVHYPLARAEISRKEIQQEEIPWASSPELIWNFERPGNADR